MPTISKILLIFFLCNVLLISGCHSLLQIANSHISYFFNFSIAYTINATAFAAPPIQGWKELCKGASQKMEGPKLTVKWSGNAQPLAIGWIGSMKYTKVSSKVSFITIDRVGLGKVPSQLLIVPKDNGFQPKVLDISENQKELNFSTRKISADEVWLWGNTLKSHCRNGCENEQAHEINVSYHQSGRFISKGRGVFLLKLRKSLHQQPLLFFGSETSLHHISIDGFQQVITNVLKSKETAWGTSHEAKVKFSNDKPCPVY